MLNNRSVIAKRADDQAQTFGKQGQPRYAIVGEFWAAADFSRGTKALREGAMDAYDTLMFRLRYTDQIDRWCLIQLDGKWYSIQSFHPDKQANQIQITAQEMPNQQVTIV